jgi:SulP family sulfate permease
MIHKMAFPSNCKLCLIAVVGLIESLLTAQIVDDYTDTESDKNKEARGQGMANIVSGLFGGMAGCAI